MNLGLKVKTNPDFSQDVESPVFYFSAEQILLLLRFFGQLFYAN